MGMFDWVRCGAKLPKPEPMDGDYQTKDTDCRLDRYTINADGALSVEYFDPDAVPQFAPPKPFIFNGTMYFYGTTKQTGRWKEYKAEFVDGKMESVESVWRGDD